MSEVSKIKAIAAKIESDNLSAADLSKLYARAAEQTPTVDTKRIMSAILVVASNRALAAA